MATIHRLLCTHCTFGSSELEPNTAENAAKVLGYSVRRSSLPEPDRGPLRTAFRAVERLLSYDAPKDTPPAKKELLEAATAPRRLVFLPSLGGWQAAAHVAYRTRDTHGRIGSYFADVLASRLDRDAGQWSPLAILQLWAASHDGALRADWWCDSEEALAERDGDARWKPTDAGSPADLRVSDEPFLNDELLRQFLTLEPGEPATDPGGIVPPRWWSMPARQRRDLVAAMLAATIQSRRNGGKENVVVAAEPSVAALLFYGVFRLLPPGLREGIGFSTYEAAPERPLTPLVATTFLDGQASAADLPPELAGRGFACNTFRDPGKFGRTQPIPEAGFVRRAIDLAAAADGWDRLDGFLAAIDALPRPDFRNLDEFARLDAFVTDYVAGVQKVDRPAPEPTVSSGSDAEKFRRIRFRGLVGELAGVHGGKWPRDVVRRAIAWLGDEFASDWDGGGPVADAVRSRLPDDDAGLAKVFDALHATRAVSPAFVAEAVVRVAVAASPPALPHSFATFIGGGPGKGKGGAASADATALVQTVIEGLAARNLQDLLAAPDPAFVDPILDAVAAWETSRPGRWRDLGVPLLPLVERTLQVQHTSTMEQAAFFVGHQAIAKTIGQNAVPPSLTAAIDDFFGRILRLSPKTAKLLKPGELLSADGQSRATALAAWLCLMTPGHARHRYEERLTAWRTVHDIVSRLREPAGRAGRFSKCTEDLAGFAQAYALLTGDHPASGNSATDNMKSFLALSMTGLRVDAQPARDTIVRWLVAATPDDLGIAPKIAPQSAVTRDVAANSHKVPARVSTKQSKGGGSKLPVAAIGTAAVIALVGVGVAMLWKPHEPPATAQTTSREPGSEATPKPPEPPAVAPITPPASANTGQPPHPPKPDSEPKLTPETLGFNAVLENGTIKATWNAAALNGEKLELHVTPPDAASTQPAVTVQEPKAGAWDWQPPKEAFVAYEVQLVAQSGTSKVASAKVPISVPKPPLPQVTSSRIDVADGQPTLTIHVAPPSEEEQRQHGKFQVVVSTTAGLLESTSLKDSLAFELPKTLHPSSLLAEQSPLKLRFETSLGKGDECEVKVPSGDWAADLCDRVSRNERAGVPYVCAMENQFTKEKATPLLDLPWWFVDAAIKDFDIHLLPPGSKSTTDQPSTFNLTPHNDSSTDRPKRWECKLGETVIGFFEIYRPRSDPWKSAIRFVAISTGDGDIEKAYGRLLMCKLCFLKEKKPICTAQLTNPHAMGPLEFCLKLKTDQKDQPNAWEHEEKVPELVAPVPLPIDWKEQPPRKLMSGTKLPDRPPKTLVVALNRPENMYVANLVASIGDSQVTAAFAMEINMKALRFRILNWRWKNVPAVKDNSKTKGELPALAGDSVSPKLLERLSERKKRLDELEVKRKTATNEDERRQLDKQFADLAEKRTEQNDDLFLPCLDLFNALRQNDIQISEWQFTWEVQAQLASGVAIPANIPGGLTVYGAVGTPDGVPVIFKPK